MKKFLTLVFSFFIVLFCNPKHKSSSVKNLSVLFKPVDTDQLRQRAFVSGYGYKTAHLIELDNFLKTIQTNNGIRIAVPEFVGISDREIKNFLLRVGFDFKKAWTYLIQETMPISEQQKAFIKKSLPLRFKKKLKKLSNTLKDLCIDASKIEISEEIKTFIDTCSYRSWRLMIRSSGKEDMGEQTHAGGNHTEINVPPLIKQVVKAIGKVLASYVSEQSLMQRLQAGDKTIFDEPLIPILMQRMAGEPLMKGLSDVSVCGNSPIFASGCVVHASEMNGNYPEVTVIQSSYGHNRGVVANLVPVDTYYQGPSGMVHQIIRVKEKRLIPVEKKGAAGLVLRDNPSPCVKRSALSKTYVQIINRLVKLLQLFYGYPIDLELVCCPQEKAIYLVQMRPLLSNQQKDNPSYLESIDGYSAEHVIPVKMIVSGNCHVQQLTQVQQVVFAGTLDQALHAYLNAPHKEKINVLIVEQDATQTSHAATVLRSEGKLVLVCKEIEKVRHFFMQQECGVLLDVQRQVLVKHNKKTRPTIGAGWFLYPLSCAVSVPRQAICSPLSQVCDQYPDFSTKVLLEKMKTATLAEGILLFNALLAKIKQHMHGIHRMMKSSTQEVITLHQRNGFQALKQLHALLLYLSDMTPEIKIAMTYPSRSRERLYPLRFVEAALFQADDSTVVRSYSVQNVLHRYEQHKQFIEDEFLPLIQEQKIGLSFLYDELFFHYACMGVKQAKTDEIKEAWLMFLDSFYTVASSQERERFHEMIKKLNAFALFAQWLNSSFITFYTEAMDEEASARDAFLLMHHEYTVVFKEMQLFENYKQRMKLSLAAGWEDHRLFEYHYKQLESHCFNYFLSGDFAELINSCSHSDSFLRKAAVASLLHIVSETIGKIITLVKTSKYDTYRNQKIRQVKKLLYLHLLFAQQLGLSPYFGALIEQVLHVTYHEHKTFKLSPCFNRGILLGMQENLTQKKYQPRQMSLRGIISPLLTLEDTHVALCSLSSHAISHLIDVWGLSHVFKKAAMSSPQSEKHNGLTGMVYGKDDKLYFYHDQLGADRLSVSVQYVKKHKMVSLKLDFHGENHHARWIILKDYLALVARVVGLPVKQVRLTEADQLCCMFELSSETQLVWFAGQIEEIIAIIFDEAGESDLSTYQKTKALLNRLFKRLHGIKIEQAVFDFLLDQGKTKKRFNLFLALITDQLTPSHKNLAMLLQKAVKKAEEFWQHESSQAKPLVFLLLEMICLQMKKLSNDQEIVRLAETDFEILAHSALELDDDDNEDEVIELLIQEIKDGLKKIITSQQASHP